MSVHQNDDALRKLEQIFTSFSKITNSDSNYSPLYSNLSAQIAQDSQLLELASFAQKCPPIPNMLFGAVHFLLLQDPTHKLSRFYPTIVGVTDKSEINPFILFKEFCISKYETIKELLKNKRVQTNEIQRCALLLPGFELISRLSGNKPLTLIEIGPSAGFNLNFDKYSYDYGLEPKIIIDSTPILLKCALRGTIIPPLPKSFPNVVKKFGIEINPINFLSQEDMLWLKALIWPEHVSRFNLINEAIKVAKLHPPEIIKGDALVVIEDILKDIPEISPICIFHTFALNQFSEADREKFYEQLRQISLQKIIYELAIEWIHTDTPVISLKKYEKGAIVEKILGICHSHGEWLEWKDL